MRRLALAMALVCGALMAHAQTHLAVPVLTVPDGVAAPAASAASSEGAGAGMGQGVVGLIPTPLALYNWDSTGTQWHKVPNSYSLFPSENTPQAVAFYGWNAGLGQWTPCTEGGTDCLGGGTSLDCASTGDGQLLASNGSGGCIIVPADYGVTNPGDNFTFGQLNAHAVSNASCNGTNCTVTATNAYTAGQTVVFGDGFGVSCLADAGALVVLSAGLSSSQFEVDESTTACTGTQAPAAGGTLTDAAQGFVVNAGDEYSGTQGITMYALYPGQYPESGQMVPYAGAASIYANSVTIGAAAPGTQDGEVDIWASGEDGILLCTAAGVVPASCPATNNGPIVVTAGTDIDATAEEGAINFTALAGPVNVFSENATNFASYGGWEVDDGSDVAGIQLNEFGSSGNIELSNSGSGNISLDSAGGISLEDGSGAGVDIDSNTGDLRFSGANLLLTAGTLISLDGAIQFPTLTGSGASCLHVDASGNLSRTSADCGTGAGGSPSSPANSVQIANSGVTGFTSDPDITINATNHTMNWGGALPANYFTLANLSTIPSSWTEDVTSATTALSSLAGNPSAGTYLVNCTDSTHCGVTAGGVTNIATGTGLTGGPITGTGTISLASVGADNLLMNSTGATAAPVATAVPDCASGVLTYSHSTHVFTCVSVPQIVAAGQTAGANASVSLFTAYTPAAAGVFRLCAAFVTTTAGASGATLQPIANFVAAGVAHGPGISGAVGATAIGQSPAANGQYSCITSLMDASQPIKVGFTVGGSPATNPTYTYWWTVEQLQ